MIKCSILFGKIDTKCNEEVAQFICFVSVVGDSWLTSKASIFCDSPGRISSQKLFFTQTIDHVAMKFRDFTMMTIHQAVQIKNQNLLKIELPR